MVTKRAWWRYMYSVVLLQHKTTCQKKHSWPTEKSHDDVIKWKCFLRYWPFVREIHRSPVNSPHKGQWRRTLLFSLICVWTNGWVNNRDAGDFRRNRAHYDLIIMLWCVRSRHDRFPKFVIIVLNEVSCCFELCVIMSEYCTSLTLWR